MEPAVLEALQDVTKALREVLAVWGPAMAPDLRAQRWAALLAAEAFLGPG